MSSRTSFHLGRRLLACLAIVVGFKIFTAGITLYDDPLNHLRKLVLPHGPATFEAFGQNITFEQLNEYIVKTLGALFMIAGILIMINRKCLGPTILIVAVLFTVSTRGNPWLQKNLVDTNSLRNIKILDILA